MILFKVSSFTILYSFDRISTPVRVDSHYQVPRSPHSHLISQTLSHTL